MEDLDYKKLVEAALFMSPRAMSVQEISNATGIASMGNIQEIMERLMEQYRKDETALEIVKISEKYMFSLKEPYASKVGKLATGPDLSRNALRILAYVSKNEGVMQSALVKMFGSATYDYMKELSEKEFVEAKKVGRSKKIMTTTKFKEYFNV